MKKMLEKGSTANLYGLRAGLSFISKEKDAIEDIEQRVRYNDKVLQDKLSEAEKLNEGYARRLSSFKFYAHEYVRSLFLSLLFLVIFTTGFALSIKYFVVVNGKYAGSTTFETYLYGIIISVAAFAVAYSVKFENLRVFAIVVAVICGIVSVLMTIYFIDFQNGGKYQDCFCGLLLAAILLCGGGALISFIVFIKSIKGAISNTNDINEVKNYLKEQSKLVESLSREVENRLKNLYAWRLQNLRPRVQNVYNMYVLLRNTYRNMLDERDWKNLDLVIYNLETRRADSIKEALQLVDRELQTRRLENLIVGATNYIVGTMKQGFAMLQNTLVQVYEGLSNQLQNISSQLTSINNTIVASSTLNSALLAKANVTSEALVNDLNIIRSNSEYMTSILKKRV